MDKSKEAANIFNKLAEGYQEKFMNVDHYASTLNFFCESIKKENASILELACGPGNVTKFILNKRRDFKLFGTDLAPNMIELAKKNNPSAKFEVMDCRDMRNIQQKFDGILFAFGLPYLNKEEALKFISDSAKLLNKDGVLYLSTMEDDHSRSEYKKGSTGDEIFMNFHEGTYLIKALEDSGFKILRLKRQDFKNSDGTMTVDLIIVAQL
jgi:ubiquinone/menaquinone biosynthesis C-methylase UbiE